MLDISVRRMIAASAAALLVVLPVAAVASPCGDHDRNEVVDTTDALTVLRAAVGFDAPVDCSGCAVTTTTTTTTTLVGASTTSTTIIDECFEDSDCAVRYWWPPGYFCGSYECLECDFDRDCAPGFDCREDECLPALGDGPCGDHDANGRVAASDALAVLRKALGFPVSLSCPMCLSEAPTEIALSIASERQCFGGRIAIHLGRAGATLPTDVTATSACTFTQASVDAGCNPTVEADGDELAFLFESCDMPRGAALVRCELYPTSQVDLLEATTIACGGECADDCPTTVDVCLVGDDNACMPSEQ